MSPPPPSTSAAATPPSHCSVRKRTAAPPPVPPPSPRKFRSLTEIMRVAKPAIAVTREPYSDVRCVECRSGERDDEMLLCDRCDRGFHLFCLRPIVIRVPSGPWFCSECTEERPLRRFPMMQKKIIEFFGIQKCVKEEKCGLQLDGKRRKRHSLVMYKKRRRFLPYIPCQSEVQRLKQMGSLATALTALGMEFFNELTYMPGMAPRSANQANLEKGGMQVLAREDKETLEHCRTMYSRGECPPLLVVFDSVEGFTVQADGQIKDMTLIAEYTGDVDYLINREHDDCDSIMTLLLTAKPSNSLVICPDKRGNVARFISGINNHTQEGRKKQNLKCVRYNVDGECRVLLVANRDISSGERLYYDYNGSEQEYPTHHFV